MATLYCPYDIVFKPLRFDRELNGSIVDPWETVDVANVLSFSRLTPKMPVCFDPDTGANAWLTIGGSELFDITTAVPPEL